ncbi:hypothetical protein ACFY7A_30145 [Streptomyces longwoodensis]|uniref:hypothetical protein n=1 Tax=Streptomyces longwoodensis TaxID=68231 RepID=UPI0036A007EE
MAQYPTIPAGTTLTAGLLMSMLPQHARKPASTPRASTIVVAPDPDLQLPVAANADYLFQFYLRISGDPAADMDIKVSVPSGATGSYTVTGRLAGASTADSDPRTSTRIAFNVETQFSTPSTAAAQGNHGAGRLTTGANAGTLSIDWAQTVSNATATVMEGDSWLFLQRLA